MDLSIIIVNWNTCDLLANCLKSVYETVQDTEFETFVVDNNSTDGSLAMVNNRFPQVQLIQNHTNLGFGEANNQAIRESKGRFIFLLNSDAFLTGGTVRRMVNALERHQEIGILGANLFFPDGHPQISHGPLPTLFSEIGSLLGLDKSTANIKTSDRTEALIETGVVSGACMMLRKLALDEIGLFDKEFFMFSEEVDLCLRAHRAGWKVAHAPFTRVIHIGGGSTGLTERRIRMLYQGKLQYFKKHYGAQAYWILQVAIILSAFMKASIYNLKHVFGLNRSNKDKFWQEVFMGLIENRLKVKG